MPSGLLGEAASGPGGRVAPDVGSILAELGSGFNSRDVHDGLTPVVLNFNELRRRASSRLIENPPKDQRGASLSFFVGGSNGRFGNQRRYKRADRWPPVRHGGGIEFGPNCDRRNEGPVRQFGAAAQQAQAQISTAAAQIGSTIGALQTKVASLAGSIGSGMTTTFPDPDFVAVAEDFLSASSNGPDLAADEYDSSPFHRRRVGARGPATIACTSGVPSCKANSTTNKLFFETSKPRNWPSGKKSWRSRRRDRERASLSKRIYFSWRSNSRFRASEMLSRCSMPTKRCLTQSTPEKSRPFKPMPNSGRFQPIEELAQLRDLLETKWALDQDYFTKKLTAAENDMRTRQRLSDEERLAYEKFLTEKQKLDVQAAQNSERAWLSLMQPIQRAFDTSITGMILGTTTLQKAVANITQSIIGEFVNLGVKMVTNWIASELAMTTATEAGAAARTAAESEGLAAGLALKALNAIKSIVTDSAQAFGGIFAFLAPIMGPAAAGPAAAGEATVMAAAGGIASAAGGWVVPSDQLAMVHQNEMILPANISQGLQSMISANGGSRRRSGGDQRLRQ